MCWTWGTVHVKDFRAQVCRYTSIHGELKLDTDCVEVRNGRTDTGKKIESYIPISVIKTITFD